MNFLLKIKNDLKKKKSANENKKPISFIFDENSVLSMKKFYFLFILTLFSNLQITIGQTFRIFEKPIIFNEEREKLSLEYLKNRHGIEKERATIEPSMIVVHWTAVPTLEATFDVFNPVHLGGRPEISSASNLNVSAHFLVDRDGIIFRLLPDTTFARHTIGLNYMAIGIENIGGPEAPLTKAQLRANAELIRYLSKKYSIKYLIGHHEYYSFQGSILWKETDPNYLTQKEDPGDQFMKQLRRKLADLNLKHKP
ncbi:N-acetylmuramoyl-L-alanine amidase [Cecembia rubra]|uniref:N-acetylmuramoyl-L-alanine amidase n=2 Tax=Cecembia rubra TaxID=1485585 RepID=A0A2P8EAC7_9BACT|nr:N-acetylmuramoyl-L-alanine amidase [Cecembia rubra]